MGDERVTSTALVHPVNSSPLPVLIPSVRHSCQVVNRGDTKTSRNTADADARPPILPVDSGTVAVCMPSQSVSRSMFRGIKRKVCLCVERSCTCQIDLTSLTDDKRMIVEKVTQATRGVRHDVTGLPTSD